jgi:hypothetical protein
MLAAGAEQPLGRLVDHVLTCGKYELTAAQLAAVFALEKQLAKPSAAISKWLDACRVELDNRTRSAPEKPTDFRRAAELSCKCNDCRALAKFLADPDQPQARFPLAKHRRQHLHQVIDRHNCDCTHVTERRGSPHILVCTKTTASYEAACRIHEQDLKNLARIVAIEKKLT